ncbi:disease resistance protein RGA2-like [Silene latifolia]|uniref:disease resistance protein RGA2-like n=1 Tax=Silene latifolia TaxID=37657 RepID=UPI003D785482
MMSNSYSNNGDGILLRQIDKDESRSKFRPSQELTEIIITELQSVCSISKCKSELDDLLDTVETVGAVLEDADAKQDSLNCEQMNYIKKLKDAVYDADDVLDEFLTLAKQNRLRSNKVTSFFSQFKFLTHNLSSKVKTVNDKLTTITAKRDKYSLKDDYKPKKYTKEETSSLLYDKIIGREEEVEKIIGMLLGSDNEHDPHVSFLAIWGIGGLGKTALAKLVYNDPRIREAFPLKRWTCIADQDQKQLDVTAFCRKVVKGSSISDKTSSEDVQCKVVQELEGKKYFLVLDDMWAECYDEWQVLKGILEVGGRGSRIMVTTRSEKTAKMIGGEQVLKLGGLLEPESWHLFERLAFEKKERDDELVKLGKEIVKKCSNVPLAIRVVGSNLHGQPKSTWFDYYDKGLDSVSGSSDKIRPILMLSYHQLNSYLKSCFKYCAIFPKDWEISTQMLIRLWMAQGYINSENLGEQYVLILLQRCFFQDIREDDLGGIVSFKLHDLWHDIAEKVADEEICRFNIDTSNVGKRVRHLSFMSDPCAQHNFNSTHIRSCLQIKGHYTECRVDQLLASKSIMKWTCLRSLDLSYTQAKTLPESICKLLHLRSLDLSWSRYLKVLPKSITKLVNLQTLNLHKCTSLKQVPDDVSKLVDLSTLNVDGCYELSCMPAGISMLTCLQTLCQFVVGVRPSSTSKQCFNGLKDLQHMNKLKGRLNIEIAVLKDAKFVKEEHGGGGYLRNKEHVETIVINFRRGEEYGSKESEQALLEEMQPHHNVKTLNLEGYHGETIPRWPRGGDNSALLDLPNLVTLKIEDCSDLVYLPWQIGKLPRLKTLEISRLSKMEYLADVDSETLVSGEGSSFFPSLDNLRLSWLPELKGWWRRSESGSQVVNPNDSSSSREANLEWVSFPCFPLLKNLRIQYCQQMMFFPVCSLLEHLEIQDFSRELFWKDMRSTPRHQTLEINNLEWLKSMPIEYSQFLVKIDILSHDRLESLGEVKEFPTCLSSSLQSLYIVSCWELKSVGGWLEHLSALEFLKINNCPKLELGGMSWHNLAATLQYLILMGIKETEELPEGVQYCTSLRLLYIKGMPKLKSVPKWMPKLISLEELTFWDCSERLIERCQQPNGDDWPLIRHIPILAVD